MLNGVFSAGMKGVQNGLNGLGQNAHKIAAMGGKDGRGTLNEMTTAAVDQIKNENQVEASVKVLKTGNDIFETTYEMLGNKIDLKA